MIRVGGLIGIIVMMAGYVSQSCGAEYGVASPDGRNRLVIKHSDSSTTYSVFRDGQEIIEGAPVSITIDGKKFPGKAEVERSDFEEVDQVVEPVVSTIGSRLRDQYNQRRIRFAGGCGLCLRAYDDGVAFRWESASGKRQIVVNQEGFTLKFREDVKVYFPIPNGKGFISHQESDFKYKPVSQTGGDKPAPAPLLFDLGKNNYLLATDVNVEGYPGLWITGSNDTKLTGVFPGYPARTELKGDRTMEVVKREAFLAKTVGERTFPWRVFVLGNGETLLSTAMPYLLADKGRIDDPSWIKPGKVAWDWWNALNIYDVPFKAGVNQETYKYYIDFAAENGIPYIILDEGWSVPGPENLLKVVPEIEMAELVAYGRSRQVGIILWMTSVALEANFDRAFEQFERWGVAGLKIDFMQRDDQVMMDFLYKAAREAAKHKMIVDYHGGSKPAGINRTWPNVLTIESVNGLEQSKWCDKANPAMAVLLPFIRMVAGPMDYTPGAMNNLQKKNFKPMFARPASMGTRAQQLAMYVVYLSPLQMLADSPNHYRENPESLAFLRQVPVTWDETKVLAAEVGEYVVVARRKGQTWYVGAMTDWTKRDIVVPLDFLGQGNYEMSSWVDGPNADRYGSDIVVGRSKVAGSGKVNISMVPGGGFAGIIKITVEK